MEEKRRLTRHATIFGFVFVAMILSTLLPLRQYQASKVELRGLLRQEKALDAQSAALTQEKKRLSSDGEVERLAREHLNMVRPGEVAFAISGAGPVPGALSAPAHPAPAKKPHRPWYKAFWHWVWD